MIMPASAISPSRATKPNGRVEMGSLVCVRLDRKRSRDSRLSSPCVTTILAERRGMSSRGTRATTGDAAMAVKFNHTIVSSRDKRASATFLAGILGLPGPIQWGPFQVVRTDNDANIDFI